MREGRLSPGRYAFVFGLAGFFLGAIQTLYRDFQGDFRAFLYLHPILRMTGGGIFFAVLGAGIGLIFGRRMNRPS